MTKRTLFGAGLALLLAAPLALAQTVDIGGTTLELGASRADALAVANAQFELTPAQTRGQYTIYPKRGPGATGNAPFPPAIGTLTVRDGRLVRVTRNLGSFRSAAGEAAVENLITAFARVPGRGKTPSIRTDTGLSGDASTSRVYFSYPDRAIQIVVFRPANRSGLATIDITEQYALAGSGLATVPQN